MLFTTFKSPFSEDRDCCCNIHRLKIIFQMLAPLLCVCFFYVMCRLDVCTSMLCLEISPKGDGNLVSVEINRGGLVML